MTNMFHQTYTPKYVSVPYTQTVIGQMKKNTDISTEKPNFLNSKFKQNGTYKPQFYSDAKQAKPFPIQSKSTIRKPRASAFQLYRGQQLNQSMPEQSVDASKLLKRQTGTDANLLAHPTRYFTNNNTTKKANSEQESPRSKPKVNQTTKQRLHGAQIKTTQKPVIYEKTRKGSMGHSQSEIKDDLQQIQSQPNLKRFKPPTNNALRQQFQRILDGNDLQLFDRKTEKSLKSKTNENVVMTKKQLQILELKQSLSEVQRLRMQDKLHWLEQQKLMISTIHRLQNQIKDFKDEKLAMQKILNHQESRQLNNYHHSTEQISKDKTIKQLENKNTLLISSLASLQNNYNELNSQFSLQRSSLITELNKAKQASLVLNHHNLSYNSVEKKDSHSYQPFYASQELKKQNAIKEEYINMLLMKNDMMQKQLSELKFSGNKLKVTEKLLGENNQSIFKFCLRKLDHEYLTLIN